MTKIEKCKYHSSNKIAKVVGAFCRLNCHRSCIKYGFDIPSSVRIVKEFKIFYSFGRAVNSKLRVELVQQLSVQFI